MVREIVEEVAYFIFILLFYNNIHIYMIQCDVLIYEYSM